MKSATLLVNLGTPEAPTAKALRVYLKDFLMDPEVIRLPLLFRWILVHLIIVPLRSASSAKKYRSIWSKEGSPLLLLSQKFLSRLKAIDENVFLAMRYGQPSIGSELTELSKKGYEKIRIVPLYPQYATSTTRSVENEVIKFKHLFKELHFIESFSKNSFYLKSLSTLLNNETFHKGDHLLFSFHGIPVSHLADQGFDCAGNWKACQGKACGSQKDYCYLHQCQAQYSYFQKELEQKGVSSSLSFQSRLGKAQWLGPSSQEEVLRLRKQGVTRLFVVCPSFVADCLETLEEIDMELRQLFLTQGGKEFFLIPCLNDNPTWVENFYKTLESSDIPLKVL